MLKLVAWPISRRKRVEQQRFQALIQQPVSVVQILQHVHVKPVTAPVQAVRSCLLSRLLVRIRRHASVVGVIRPVLVLLANVYVAPAQKPRPLLFRVPIKQLASVAEMIRVVHVQRANVLVRVVQSKPHLGFSFGRLLGLECIIIRFLVADGSRLLFQLLLIKLLLLELVLWNRRKLILWLQRRVLMHNWNGFASLLCYER